MRSIRPADVTRVWLTDLRWFADAFERRAETLHVDLARIGLASLYLILMFVTVYAEASIAWERRLWVWHAMLVIYETVSLCTAAIWPRIGSWPVVGIWVIGTLVPMTTTFPISAPFAVAVLGGYRLWWGLSAGVVCAASRLLSFALMIEPWPGLSGAISLCALFLLAACVGAALNGQYERLRERDRRRMMRRDRMIVDQLHDHVCNTLAYLVCAMDDGMLNVEATSGSGLDRAGVRELLEDALCDARMAITLMRRNAQDDGGFPARGATAVPVRADSPSLAQTATALQRRLSMAGVNGDVFVDELTDLLSDADTARLAASFMRELFGDIGKYADRSSRYMVCVAVRSDVLTIDASNVVRSDRNRDGPLSGGSGLQRYRQAVERLGGSLTVVEQDGIWSLASAWPVRKVHEA